MRTVEISKHESFDDVVVDNKAKAEAAICYLSMWAFDSENKCKVTLYCDREGNINATYRDAKG